MKEGFFEQFIKALREWGIPHHFSGFERKWSDWQLISYARTSSARPYRVWMSNAEFNEFADDVRQVTDDVIKEMVAAARARGEDIPLLSHEIDEYAHPRGPTCEEVRRIAYNME